MPLLPAVVAVESPAVPFVITGSSVVSLAETSIGESSVTLAEVSSDVVFSVSLFRVSSVDSVSATSDVVSLVIAGFNGVSITEKVSAWTSLSGKTSLLRVSLRKG